MLGRTLVIHLITFAPKALPTILSAINYIDHNLPFREGLELTTRDNIVYETNVLFKHVYLYKELLSRSPLSHFSICNCSSKSQHSCKLYNYNISFKEVLSKIPCNYYWDRSKIDTLQITKNITLNQIEATYDFREILSKIPCRNYDCHIVIDDVELIFNVRAYPLIHLITFALKDLPSTIISSTGLTGKDNDYNLSFRERLELTARVYINCQTKFLFKHDNIHKEELSTCTFPLLHFSTYTCSKESQHGCEFYNYNYAMRIYQASREKLDKYVENENKKRENENKNRENENAREIVMKQFATCAINYEDIDETKLCFLSFSDTNNDSNSTSKVLAATPCSLGSTGKDRYRKKHAEKRIFENLNLNLKNIGSIKNIHVVMHFSPCNYCSEERYKSVH